jgi:hypothetical protein
VSNAAFFSRFAREKCLVPVVEGDRLDETLWLAIA